MLDQHQPIEHFLALDLAFPTHGVFQGARNPCNICVAGVFISYSLVRCANSAKPSLGCECCGRTQSTCLGPNSESSLFPAKADAEVLFDIFRPS